MSYNVSDDVRDEILRLQTKAAEDVSNRVLRLLAKVAKSAYSQGVADGKGVNRTRRASPARERTARRRTQDESESESE